MGHVSRHQMTRAAARHARRLTPTLLLSVALLLGPRSHALAAGSACGTDAAVLATDVTNAPVGGYVTVLGRGLGTSGSATLNGSSTAVQVVRWESDPNQATPSRVILQIKSGAATGPLVLVRGSDSCAITAASTLRINSGHLFYVNARSTDGGDCTADSTTSSDAHRACATLNRASGLSSLTAGDQVIVHAGTYVEASGDSYVGWKVKAGGSSTYPVVFRSFPGEAVIVKPAMITCPDTSTVYRAAVSTESSYTTLSGLSFQEGWEDSLSINGNSNRIFDCDISRAHNLYNTASAPICYPPVGSGIGAHDGAANSQIIGCRIHDNGNKPNNDHGTYTCTPGLEIAYNEVYNNAGYGVQLRCGSGTADGDKVHHNWIHHNNTFGNCGGLINEEGHSQLEIYDNLVYSHPRYRINFKYGNA